MDNNKKAFDEALASLTAKDQPFEIVQRTIADVNYKVYQNAPTTLREVYLRALQHGDKECLIYQDERWTFSQLLQQAWSLAAALASEHQISSGDRVGIAMRNYPEWLTSFIAVTSMGAVAVPINSWGKAHDLLFAVRDSECKTVFCDQQRFDQMSDGLKESGIKAVVARAEKGINPTDGATLEEFIAGKENVSPPSASLDGEDDVMIMYTSGTTGKPKGAVSTHRAICQAIMNFDCTAAACGMSNPELIGQMLKKGFEPVQMLAVPLFHVSGLHAIFLTALRAGRKIVMMYKWSCSTMNIVTAESIFYT